MSFAIFLLLLASLPIIYYYLIMNQIYGKISDIFGFLAGLWSFLGIIGIYLGIVGFSYFIIFFLLIFIGFIIQIFQKILPESINDIFEKTSEILDNAPELTVHEKIMEKVPSLENRSIRLGLAILCFGTVIMLYISFFTVPVSPADSNEPLQFDRNEGYMKRFPNAYRIDYKNGRAFVIIVTLRTIPISSDLYSGKLKNEVSDITEKQAKDEYGQDIRVEFKEESSIEANGHDAVRLLFYIYEKTSGGFFGSDGESKAAEMVIIAWFCNKDFETVVVGYVYPNNLKALTENLVDSIDCH